MSARTSHGQPDAEVTYELATDQRSESTRKYHIWTIGCQMNVADSNHVAAELVGRHGLQQLPTPHQHADAHRA